MNSSLNNKLEESVSGRCTGLKKRREEEGKENEVVCREKVSQGEWLDGERIC